MSITQGSGPDSLNASQKRVEMLKAIQPNKYELWKYYEDRADRLGERLWTMGAWLMAILAAALSIPFTAQFVTTETGEHFPLKVAAPIPVFILSVFGLFFCIYAYIALKDLRDHIESNWRKSGYVLDGSWAASWSGRKSHGWNVLIGVGGLAVIAFVFLLTLSLVR